MESGFVCLVEAGYVPSPPTCPQLIHAACGDRPRKPTYAERRFAERELIYGAAPIGISLRDRDFKFIRISRHLAVELGAAPVEGKVGYEFRKERLCRSLTIPSSVALNDLPFT